MSELILRDLHKRFGDHQVLAGLDLTVPAGSFTALLGSSGAGKTTLLRLLAGFETPDLGTISVAGHVVSGERVHVAPERRRIGFVSQEGSLFPHLNVAGNVGFGLARGRRRSRVGELLQLVGLGGLERRFPHQLSGGQQQRVALARALAVDPEVVLLDEPFAALDENLREGLRHEVKRILAEAGATTLLVTHNQDEALSTADTVAVLRDGRIIQQAPPHELYAHPVDVRLASFIGAANLIDGVLEPIPEAGPASTVVRTALGRLPARWNGDTRADAYPVTALVRPEQIRCHPEQRERNRRARSQSRLSRTRHRSQHRTRRQRRGPTIAGTGARQPATHAGRPMQLDRRRHDAGVGTRRGSAALSSRTTSLGIRFAGRQPADTFPRKVG
jgi:iron(III) transport system ATP-binding protein